MVKASPPRTGRTPKERNSLTAKDAEVAKETK